MALGKLSITTASTSMTSSFCFLTRSVLFLRSFPSARAAFLPNKIVDGKCCNLFGSEIELGSCCAVVELAAVERGRKGRGVKADTCDPEEAR